MILMADMCMKAGDKELAKKIIDKLIKFCQDDVAYINSLNENLRDSKYSDAQFEFQALGYLSQSASSNGMPELGKELAEKVNMLAQQLPQMPRQ
jgi:oligoribonuclease (3'-5' exoribonuclease)